MPISIFYGNEDYLLHRAVQALKKEIINPDFGNLGYRSLSSPTLPEVLEAIGTVYFNLGGSTLIEIQEFPFLTKAGQSKAEMAQIEQLIELLQNLESHKHILFVASKISKTVKLTKWLLKQKQVPVSIKEYTQLNFWQTSETVFQIQSICREEKIQVDTKAVAMLVEQQGAQIRPILSELQKLSTYAGSRSISVQDVEKFSVHNENSFQMLTDWLLKRNAHRRLQVLGEVLLTQHPMQIFALSQSWLNHLFQLAYWKQRGMTEAEMASQTKKHPYKIKKDLELCQQVPFERLNQLRASLLEREYQSKTGLLDGKLALELLFCC